MEPGQRILKVHGDSQQVADCLTKIMTPRAAHRRALGLRQMQQVVEHRRGLRCSTSSSDLPRGTCTG